MTDLAQPSAPLAFVDTQNIHDVLQSLAEVSNSGAFNVERSRRLLRALVTKCIVGPATALSSLESLSQTGREHALFALRILRMRLAERPDVLLTTAPNEGPFYHWLVPQLIHAASRFEDDQNADDLVEKLVDAAAGMLASVGKLLSDPKEADGQADDDRIMSAATTYMTGPTRLASALHTMEAFCRDALDGQRPALFTSTNLSGDITTVLITLRVIFDVPSLFSDDVSIACCRHLASAAIKTRSSMPRTRARLANVVATALRNHYAVHPLGPTCGDILTLPIPHNVAALEDALSNLLQAVEVSRPAIRRDVWQALAAQTSDVQLEHALGRRKAAYLLTPVPPYVLPQTIKNSLVKEIAEWAANSGTLSGMEQVERQLSLLHADFVASSSVSMKRKRAMDDDGAAMAIVREIIPAADASQGPVSAIFQLIRSNDEEAITKLHSRLSEIICAASGCDVDGDREMQHTSFNSAWLDIWQHSYRHVHTGQVAMSSLAAIIQHISPEALVEYAMSKSEAMSTIVAQCVSSLSSMQRRERLVAGHVSAALFTTCNTCSARSRRPPFDLIRSLRQLLDGKAIVRETTMLLLGVLGRSAVDEPLGDVLELLILQLGSKDNSLRSLAYAQLLQICSTKKKQPYNLISPFLDRFGVLIADCLSTAPDVVSETMHFIGYHRQAFFSLTEVRKVVVPHLVLKQDRRTLNQLANIVNEQLGLILADLAAPIMSAILLTPEKTDRALDFVIRTMIQITKSKMDYAAMLNSYIGSCIVPFIVTLVVKLGDEDPAVSKNATHALSRAQRLKSNSTLDADLGTFLKPHMLGVLSAINELLFAPRSSAKDRCKIIRSIGKLAELVGDSMASFSPQIIASLQSTLNQRDLARQTLETWRVFIECLKFSDVGPYIGQTVAALVFAWKHLDGEEQLLAQAIITYIADNVTPLKEFINDIVGFETIPKLATLHQILLGDRRKWKMQDYLDKLVVRLDSKNVAIATMSMHELQHLLVSRASEISQLTRGDQFDQTIARLLSSLLGAINRDGECQELCSVAFECLGRLGALDPDRFKWGSEQTTMTLHSNFSDHDESIDFALHLIRDLLVGAFRATNDTKHQRNVAYAIQELLKFCGFDSRVIRGGKSGTVDVKVRARWDRLPKHILDTVTPLLDALFTQTHERTTAFAYPIYPSQATYRQWIQGWTVDLIGRIMNNKIPGTKGGDAQAIFSVFNSEPKNQDVAVAHHILPHLVLHTLLSGTSDTRDMIRIEISTVLLDQVSPVMESTPEKRQLSAQVIFDLMDHLSKWMRLARAGMRDRERDRTRETYVRNVEQVLSSIDTELLANAAFKSRAYARSLRNFEQRILQLRGERKGHADLQTYYENLHEIYAELDEPDGMEGVSNYVISPTLELQIREHESTGRWTSAQSCWEVRLQQSPEDVKLHTGLLKCLRNLGHYDTLRTHIRGVLSLHPDWHDELCEFETEAAWMIGDWTTVEKNRGTRHAPPLATAFLAMYQKAKGAEVVNIADAVKRARDDIGRDIATRQYSRAYESILELHVLREIEMIHETDAEIYKLSVGASTQNPNARQIIRSKTEGLIGTLADRFAITLPAFRVREEILSRRRTAFSLVKSPELKRELGQAWIQSARIARKAGYEQTAYSAALQAKEADAAYAFIQQVKLTRASGGALKALMDLKNVLDPMLKARAQHVVDLTGDTSEDVFRQDKVLAKAVLLKAKWANEADRFERNEVIAQFQEAIQLGNQLESPFYHLGHYYDMLTEFCSPESVPKYHQFTCQNYVEALHYGVKYIYQTMPRLLTIWLDLGESKETKDGKPGKTEASRSLEAITKLIQSSRGKIATYQFLTAFPQMVSRICHPNTNVQDALIRVMARVLREYPQQALWPLVGVMQSKRGDRQDACSRVLTRAKNGDHTGRVLHHVMGAQKLSSVLLRLSEDKNNKEKTMSIAKSYGYVRDAFPSTMILPLQDALTCTLPTTAEAVQSHNPFPGEPIHIHGISDKVDVMPSLQRPKKIVFIGSDGRRYPFLCKPHDDLRKDARLMDLNSMINKFLKSGSESRRRQLYIRTYAVMPLNEECGLLEWVAHTQALKSILEAGYQRYNKKIYSNDLYKTLEEARNSGPDWENRIHQAFRTKIIPQYQPSVFHEWFLTTWPEPTAWLAARTAYARTCAVMSMIGYVLGHGENILFDNTTGDTVHVDLNCLFEKGKTFEIPERVPFRLTHNMVDAMGVTGVEGVFRKASEITMGILRQNGDSLMSVLEAFLHDPLVEWTKSGRKSEKDVRNSADRNLRPIKQKLRGIVGDGTTATVPNQVDTLIKEATSTKLLALMYVGWAAWL